MKCPGEARRARMRGQKKGDQGIAKAASINPGMSSTSPEERLIWLPFLLQLSS
jgi:hypothetical protein